MIQEVTPRRRQVMVEQVFSTRFHGVQPGYQARKANGVLNVGTGRILEAGDVAHVRVGGGADRGHTTVQAPSHQVTLIASARGILVRMHGHRISQCTKGFTIKMRLDV